jgi:hypothetical protein
MTTEGIAAGPRKPVSMPISSSGWTNVSSRRCWQNSALTNRKWSAEGIRKRPPLSARKSWLLRLRLESCPKHVYKFRTGPLWLPPTLRRRRLVVYELRGVGVYAAVSSQLRIPSLTPSQSLRNVPNSSTAASCGVRFPLLRRASRRTSGRMSSQPSRFQRLGENQASSSPR